MKIQLNGEPSEFADSATVADLIRTLKLEGRRLAVELNGDIVPRSTFAERVLRDGDCIEIVAAIGGG